MSEWKPGDVAMVTDVIGVDRVMIHIGHDPASRCWHGVNPNGDINCLLTATEARPLAVIDPEGREQAERLIALYCGGQWGNSWGSEQVDAMQAALREYTKPTPPKPAEPNGIGAVVRDSKGDAWVRALPDGGGAKWRVASLDDARDPWAVWSAIDAVEVLSEGWSA